MPHDDYSEFPENGWTYGSIRHFGEKVNQKWEISIIDTQGDEDQGKLLDAEIIFYGFVNPENPLVTRNIKPAVKKNQ